MTADKRYAVIIDRCSTLELDRVWSALLLGRVRNLEPHLVPIAVAIEALRDELRAASAARSNVPLSPLPPSREHADECDALDFQLRQGEI